MSMFGGGGSSSKVGGNQVAFNPPGYTNPFGSYSYNGSDFVSTLSPEEQLGYDTDQSKLQQSRVSMPVTGADFSDATNRWMKTYLQQQNEMVLPQYAQQSYAKGITPGSSAYQRGLGSTLDKISQNAILGASDLANRQFGQQLQAGQFFGNDLQAIFNRMIGTAQQGLAGDQFWGQMANANANRQMQADAYNAAMDQQSQGGFGDLLGVGGMGLGSLLGGGGQGLSSLTNMFGGGGGGFNPLAALGLGGGTQYGTKDNGDLMTTTGNGGGGFNMASLLPLLFLL